jgi:hypothetical protein
LQVDYVQSEVEQYAQDQAAFMQRFEEGGGGWDDDRDGQVSQGEALNMMSDLGCLQDEAEHAVVEYRKLSPGGVAGVPCETLRTRVSAASSLAGRVLDLACTSYDTNGDGDVDLSEIASSVNRRNMITTSEGRDVWAEAVQVGGRLVNNAKSWLNTVQRTGTKMQRLIKDVSKFSPSKVQSPPVSRTRARLPPHSAHL